MAGPGQRKTEAGMFTNVDAMKEFDAKVIKLMNDLLAARDEAIRNILELEKGYSDITYQDFKTKFADNAKRIDKLGEALKATSIYYKENIRLTEKHLSTFFN